MKENLSSPDHQFHQYQQNKQSPLILTELIEQKKTMTYDFGNPGLGQAQKCVGVRSVNVLRTLSWQLDLQRQYI